MVTIDGINYPDGTKKDETTGDIILPKGTKCVDVKVTPSENERKEIIENMTKTVTDDVIAKVKTGQPKLFKTLSEIQALTSDLGLVVEKELLPEPNPNQEYRTKNIWVFDNGAYVDSKVVYSQTIVSPNDETIKGITDEIDFIELNIKVETENLQTQIDRNANLLGMTSQEEQNKRLDDHIQLITDLQDIVHETIVTEVKENYMGKKINVPTTANISGKEYTVLDNQLFKIDGMVGKTLIANQIIDSNEYADSVENVVVSNQDDFIIIKGTRTNTSTSRVMISRQVNYNLIANHKYLIILKFDTCSNVKIGITNWATSLFDYVNNNVFKIYENSQDINGLFIAYQHTANVEINAKFKLELIDLTKAYGVGNEPTIEECKALFYTYIPYLPDVLQSSTIKNLESYGLNKLPLPYANGDTTINEVTFKVNKDGSITANGKANGTAFYYLVSDVKPLFLPENCTLSCDYESGSYANYILSAKNVLSGKEYSDTGSGITLPANESYFIYLRINNGYEINKTFKPMLNSGNYKKPFETPFKDSTIDFNQTLNGVLTAQDELVFEKQTNELYKAKIIHRTGVADISKLAWVYNQSNPNNKYFEVTIPELKVNDSYQPDDKRAICAKYEYAGNVYSNYINDMQLGAFSNILRIKDSRYSDSGMLEDNNVGVKIIYELETPYEEEISTLKNLSIDDIATIGVKGGAFLVNPIAPNIVEPKSIILRFDIKYWQEPTPTNEGGNL